MADVVVGAVAIVSGYLVAPVNRLCGYVISYEGDVSELKAKVAELGVAKQNVKDSINYAQNNAKPIRAYVNEWVEDVEKDTEEARRVLDADESAEKTCFYGRLPNLKVRYRLSREVRRKAKDIQRLIGRIPFGQVYDDPPPGLVDGASNMISLAGDRGDTIFDSRASILKDIMNALDDEKHKVIGIYGPGGVGKTTLLEEVEEKLRKEGKPFQMIAKAEVSQTPDLNNIQGQIADALKLDLKDKESQQGRRDLLVKRLQKDPSEKILIILDDLWKEVDLRAVGIPLGDESRGSQVLLTSRYKNVLEQMKCAPHIFHLKGLKNDEAFRLFEKTVGDRLEENEQLKTIADQVVKKLAGLPLLIISVASFLKDKDECAWKNAQIEIDESNKEKKETIVKLSYKHLKSEDAKTLFLLCGLIGGTIQVETLLVLGMGLGLFGEFRRTVQDSRDKLKTLLDELRSACLLLDGGDDKKKVTIHDLYSEVVVSTPFRGQDSLMMNSNYGSWSKEKLEKCWAICLANVDKKRLEELMTCQSFPNLKILILSQLEDWDWMQEEEHEVGDCLGLLDFKNMKELRVLYFGSMHIASLPPSIGILENLHSLYLDYCNVEDVAILGKLRALQILSCANSTISRLPKEIGELTNLRLLDLCKCYNLKTIETGVLERLTNLEELYLGRCNVEDVAILGKVRALRILRCAGISRLPKEIGELTNLRSLNLRECYSLTTIETGVLECLTNLEELFINIKFREWMRKDQISSKSCNARLAELKSLTKLVALEIGINGTTLLLEDGDLPFGNLHRFRIIIGTYQWSPVGYSTAMQLDLEGCDSILSKEWIQKALQKTQCLQLRRLSEFKKSAHELCTQGFKEVKYIGIEDSPSINYIANSSDGLPLTTFRTLESLILKNLKKLEKICNGLVTPESFSKLRNITVERCDRLKYLWSLSDCQRLGQLEEIDVRKCDSMQSIVTLDAREGIVSIDNGVELSNVFRLVLWKLPNMTSFCTRAEITSEDTPIQVSLPRLESLVIDGLLGLEKILYNELSLNNSNLRSLLIRGSKSTSKSILKLDWILKLSNLELMSLGSFPSAEVVFDIEELKVTSDVEICSRLTKLTLEQLPNLQRMWKRDAKLQGISIFRNLRDLFIYETGLSFLFSVSLAKCFREIRVIRMWECPNMKAVIVDEEGRNKRTYDIIEFPLLEHLSIQQCPMEKFFSYPHGKEESVTATSDSLDAHSDSFFDRKVTFPNITSLEINGLRCKKLWNNQIPTDSFQKLESLKLMNCDNLQHIATSYMWKRLQRCLEKLEVISCRSIEIMYEGDGTNIESGKLWRLVLCNLKNLRCVWQSDSLPNIPFPNLRDVKAVRCPCLETLFPVFTAKFLGQIKELVVESCENMKQIASHEKSEEGPGTAITFSELTYLILSKLPKFRSFLPGKYSLKFPCSEDFPSLLFLSIESCGAEPVLGDWEVHKMRQGSGMLSKPDQVIGDWEFRRIENERGMLFGMPFYDM